MQLERNQEVIGWDNLMRRKFAKNWRKLNELHNRKLKDIQRQKEKPQREQEKLRETQEKEWNLYWEPMRPMKKKTVEPQKNVKQKADVFERVFAGIM